MQEVLIGRRYRLTEKIGSGGMADVYKAVDETLGRNVAVKIMHARLAADSSFAARFRQEAQAAANLQSPYIVNIYDWGHEVSETGVDVYYIVMEYVRGTDLKSIIERRGALPSRQVAEIGAQVASALSVAHGYDVIHRDIKPHNIMLSPDGNVKVMDFGIARAGNTTMTQTGSVLGSAHYVSPEQAQGRDLTAASDLYSLGIVLYEASTAQMPFDGDTPVATALKQVQEQAVRPSALNGDIDPDLEQIIGFAMAKDPRARYATAEAMRRDLLHVARGEAIAGAHGNAGAVGGGGDDKTQVLGGGGGAALAGAGAGAGGGRGVAPVDHTTVMPQVGGDVGGGGRSGGGAGAAGGYQVVGGARQKKKSGSKAWIWVLVVVLLLAGAGVLGWQMGWFGGNSSVPVPNVVGKTQAEAEDIIAKTDGVFALDAPTYAHDDQVEAGRIISQTPKDGIKVTPNENGEAILVQVVISQGEETFEVPNLKKKTLEQAQKLVADAGFEIVVGKEIYDDKIEEGKIISQDVPAATQAPKGAKITVDVSKGIESISVPGVTGQTQSEASAALEEAGFQVNVITEFSDTVAKGKVISQNPRGEVSTKKGTTVDIVVSKGKEVKLVTVPDVMGQTEESARGALQAAGFKVDVSYSPVGGSPGTVIEQSPGSGGKQQPYGSTVSITVDSGSADNPG